MRLSANAFDFKGLLGTAGTVFLVSCPQLVSSAGRANPGDEGVGEYSTGNTLPNLYKSSSKAGKMHNSRSFRATLANSLLAACGTSKVYVCTRSTRCDSELAT